MKKTILITAFVAAVFLSGCTRNETEIQTTKATSITLTATMPNEGANTTRLTLAETDDGNISVRWKDGDKIDLCFVSGETVKTINGVAVTNIREEGKKGDFAISVPEGITEPFNLYGVYGASIAENSKTVTFPAAPSGTVLTDSEPISVMRFVAENLSSTTPPSVQFVHLGAMIGISLTNASEEDYTLTSLSIESSEYDWVYNTAGQATYDIATGTFSDDKKGTALDFPATNVSISPNATEKVFRWFVPTATPELTKALTVTINGTETTQSIPAKAFAAGKYYRLKLIWDGTAWKRSWNPLSFFATHNLDILNTLATGDEQTAKGKMYQWGRNVPFAAEGTVSTVGGAAASWDDAKIWGADFISGSRVWYPNPQETDTWTLLTGKANSAPESYKGTNTTRPGDPCPEGYHVPSIVDWTTILPFSATGYGFYFKYSYDSRNEVTDLNKDGTTETYSSDYKSLSTSSMIALKFKGTVYATAFKYEWQEGGKTMKISALQVNQSVNIDQVATPAFDWSDAVIRYFPTAGNRYHNGGTIDPNFANTGYYWTSQARTTENIWVVYMDNSTAYITPDHTGCSWARSGNAYLIRCIKN